MSLGGAEQALPPGSRFGEESPRRLLDHNNDREATAVLSTVQMATAAKPYPRAGRPHQGSG